MQTTSIPVLTLSSRSPTSASCFEMPYASSGAGGSLALYGRPGAVRSPLTLTELRSPTRRSPAPSRETSRRSTRSTPMRVHDELAPVKPLERQIAAITVKGQLTFSRREVEERHRDDRQESSPDAVRPGDVGVHCLIP